jgi:membrane-associated protein
VRTLAPFVGGIGRMHYGTFITYNVVGALLWVIGITMAGYFLGNIPIIRDNFSKVVILIVIVSILPIVFEVVKEKLVKKKNNPA